MYNFEVLTHLSEAWKTRQWRHWRMNDIKYMNNSSLPQAREAAGRGEGWDVLTVGDTGRSGAGRGKSRQGGEGRQA